MTLRTDVRDGVLELLNASGTPFAWSKRRWLPGMELPKAITSVGAVFFHREGVERPSSSFPVTSRRLIFAVQVVTAVYDPAEIDDVLEQGSAWAIAKLGHTNLAGLVHDVEEGPTQWETSTQERIHGAITTLWTASYQSKRDDLTRRS